MSPKPSPEAIEAIKCARSARTESEQVIPLAESLGNESRRLREENHFREMFEEIIRRHYA